MEKETAILGKVKDIAGIFQAVATTIAISAAGIWFFCQGIHSPKANVSHLVTHRQISDDWNWVHVAVTIKNVGQRPITLKYGKVRIQKIYPLETKIHKQLLNMKNPVSEKSCVVDWPEPCKPLTPPLDCNIWPGEEERLEFEFIIPTTIETVKIYSFFEKQKTPQLGWSETTIYKLAKNNKNGLKP